MPSVVPSRGHVFVSQLVPFSSLPPSAPSVAASSRGQAFVGLAVRAVDVIPQPSVDAVEYSAFANSEALTPHLVLVFVVLPRPDAGLVIIVVVGVVSDAAADSDAGLHNAVENKPMLPSRLADNFERTVVEVESPTLGADIMIISRAAWDAYAAAY